MSKLTKEDIDPLQKCLQWLKDNPESPIEDCMSIADVAGYFEELLTLRTLRDAGDEARRDVEKWVTTVGNASRLVDSLTAELAALKSAPGMEEVDALAYWPDHEFKSQQYTKIQQLADLARRSIASREEVVGLLKEAAGYSDGRLESRAENGDPVAIRIIEIVEGK